jgi:hypothetical protein
MAVENPVCCRVRRLKKTATISLYAVDGSVVPVAVVTVP